MPTYSEAGTTVTTTFLDNSADGVSDSGLNIGLLSVRPSIMNTVATTLRLIRIFTNPGILGSTVDQTPEKFSSRSPASIATNFANINVGSLSALIYCIQIGFNNCNWIAQPRAVPQGRRIAVLSALTSGESSAFDDQVNGKRPIRGRMRRTTKPGFFSRFGNEINRMAVTGGGAFSAIYPVFQNDITWVDPTAWKNGMAQSDIFNMPLLTTTPAVVVVPQRMMRGVGV